MIRLIWMFFLLTFTVHASDYVTTLDQFHNYSSDTIRSISTTTDNYLNPKPLDALLHTREYDALTNKTKLHLRMGVVTNKEEDTHTYTSIRVRLDLPELRKRLKLYIEDLQERQSDKASNTTLQKDDSAIGLSLLANNTKKIKTKFKAGVKFGGFLKHGPNPYARYRIEVPIAHDTLDINARQSFEISHRDEYFQDGSFVVDMPLNDTLTRRFLVSYSYSSKGSGVNYYIENSFLKQNAHNIGYHVGISNSGTTTNAQAFSTNSLFFTWYKSLYKDWIYYSIEPRILFQDEYDYKPNPEIGFYVTVEFD